MTFAALMFIAGILTGAVVTQGVWLRTMDKAMGKSPN